MTGAYRKTKFKFTYEVDTVLLQLIYKHRQEIYHRGSTCKGWNQILEQFNRRVSANILQSRTLNNRFKALRKDINLRIKSRVLVGEELNENEKMLMYLNEYFSKKAGKVIEKEKRNGLLIGPEGEGEVEGDAEGDVERDVEGNAEVEAETRGKEQGQKGERKKRRRREKTPGFGQMMYMEYPYIDEMEREGGEEVGEEGKNGSVQPHQQQQQQQQQHQPNQQHHQHHQQHHQHHQQQHQQHQQHHQQHHTSFSSSTRSSVSSQGYYNILPSHSPPRIASPKIPFSALEIDKDDYRGTFDMYQSPKPQLDFNANLTSPQYAKFPKDVDQMAVVQSLQHAQLQQTQEIQDIKKEFYSFKYEIGTKLEQILESLNRPR